MIHVRALGFAALFVILAAAGPTSAAGDANAAKGLVADHCSKCHEVPGYSTAGHPTLKPPPFQNIADNATTYTEARVRAFLARPHWPMTQFNLSPSDIDNIVAFLKSLRAD